MKLTNLILQESLSDNQRQQIEDLIHHTIIPAINEDLGIESDEEEVQAIHYLINALSNYVS